MHIGKGEEGEKETNKNLSGSVCKSGGIINGKMGEGAYGCRHLH